MIHYQDRWAVVTGASSGLGRGVFGYPCAGTNIERH